MSNKQCKVCGRLYEIDTEDYCSFKCYIADQKSKNKVYCFQCEHYLVSYWNVSYYLHHVCNKYLDYVTGTPRSCCQMNSDGDCEGYEEKT